MNQSTVVPSSYIGITKRPLVWLNVVCLDAPLVAWVWQWFFARNLHIDLPRAGQVALFFTAWFIYLVDRFVDSVALPKNSEKTLREAFCLRHTTTWMGLILTIGLFDSAFILWRLDHKTFVGGAGVGAIAVIYLVLNFAFSKIWSAVPIKEIAVGFLFAAGTLVSLLPHLNPANSSITKSTFGLVAFLFACLCSLNCMSIAVWEGDLDRSQGKHSVATRLAHANLLVEFLAVILSIASFVLRFVSPPLWPLSDGLALSAVALLVLNFLPIARDERTALADLVLLTPACWLLIGRIT